MKKPYLSKIRQHLGAGRAITTDGEIITVNTPDAQLYLNDGQGHGFARPHVTNWHPHFHWSKRKRTILVNKVIKKRFFTLIFIDEADPIYFDGPERYDTDLQEYQSLVLKHTIASLLLSPKGTHSDRGWEYCIPEGYSKPEGIYMENISREPELTVEEITSFYEDVLEAEEFAPTEVLVGIDQSGSMTLTTINPAYTEFKEYIAEAGLEIEEVFFSNERWLYLMNEKIKEWAS